MRNLSPDSPARMQANLRLDDLRKARAGVTSTTLRRGIAGSQPGYQALLERRKLAPAVPGGAPLPPSASELAPVDLEDIVRLRLRVAMAWQGKGSAVQNLLVRRGESRIRLDLVEAGGALLLKSVVTPESDASALASELLSALMPRFSSSDMRGRGALELELVNVDRDDDGG